MADKEIELQGVSIGIFNEDNPVRVFLSHVVASSFFEAFILMLILATSIMMALESPLDDPESQKSIILAWVNDACTIIFLLEMIIKIIVYGLVCNGDNSYLKGGWNILDMVIVITSLTSMII